MVRLSSTVLCCLLISTAASAQTVTDGRAWFTLTLQGRMSRTSRWRWSFDGIVRSRDGLSTLDTASVRPTVLYEATKHLTLGGGYTCVAGFPAAGGVATEQRVFGIALWTVPARGGTLTLRARLEDRFIEGNSGPVWRARPLARFSRPFRANGPLSWVAYDEFDLHLNTTTRYPRGVDQNRAFGGVSMTLSSRLRTEIGYLNQYQPGHGAANRMNHVISGTATITF